MLFVLYVNDLPNACTETDIFLFADDTNVTAINCSISSRLNNDLDKLNTWLYSNRLTLNPDKTLCLKFLNKNAFTSMVCLNNNSITHVSSCKYLRITLDSNLNYDVHIDNVPGRLRQQCGILRLFLPRKNLIQYYSSNIKLTIHYGTLVYGCTTYNKLLPLLTLQKKILRIVLFKHCNESFTHEFAKNSSLTVHELYLYEILKFTVRSLAKFHAENYLNDMFSFENTLRTTRRLSKTLLVIPKLRNRLQQFSWKCRCSKLFKMDLYGLVSFNKLWRSCLSWGIVVQNWTQK